MLSVKRRVLYTIQRLETETAQSIITHGTRANTLKVAAKCYRRKLPRRSACEPWTPFTDGEHIKELCLSLRRLVLRLIEQRNWKVEDRRRRKVMKQNVELLKSDNYNETVKSEGMLDSS